MVRRIAIKKKIGPTKKCENSCFSAGGGGVDTPDSGKGMSKSERKRKHNENNSDVLVDAIVKQANDLQAALLVSLQERWRGSHSKFV
jgi:hypothetical protein